MITSEQVFETRAIEVAAALVAAGFEVNVLRAPEGRRAIFEFADTPELRDAVVGFEGGRLLLNAKRLLGVRAWLFRKASSTVKGGGE